MLAISVLIVNYNSGNRLANVYRALERQTFDNFEVIVVDNDSSDASIYAAPPKTLCVHVVKNSNNTGFAGGVMDGLPHAKGDWIAFLNPDAYPEPEWLEALARASKAYGTTTALGSIQVNASDPSMLDGLGDVYHASGVAWRGAFGKPRSKYPVHTDKEIFAPCFAAAMVHRQTFLDEGGLDRDFFCYHEDVDFGFRHRLRGGRAVLVHDAIVHHEGSAISGRYSAFTVTHGIRNRFWTLIKNMPITLLPISMILFVAFSGIFLIRSFTLGIGTPFIRGWCSGVMGARQMWKKRPSVSGHTPVGWRAIANAITWSPIAPFRRAPNLRPWHDEQHQP